MAKNTRKTVAVVVPNGADAALPFNSAAAALADYTPAELQAHTDTLATENRALIQRGVSLYFHNGSAMHAAISNGAFGKSKNDAGDVVEGLYANQGAYGEALGVGASSASRLVRVGRAIALFGYTPDSKDWGLLISSGNGGPAISKALMGTSKRDVTSAIAAVKRGDKPAGTPREDDGSKGETETVEGETVETVEVVPATPKVALRSFVEYIKGLDREAYAAFENGVNDAFRAETAVRVKVSKSA